MEPHDDEGGAPLTHARAVIDLFHLLLISELRLHL